ncbi:hypothetical protein EDM56_28235 [Brevibacillus fluminis]|uniref:Uncharacterized protein n=1 Tax=Brevibacillus fluminis TaxID=511487 RepID=A0A3M8CWT9_9BACL|nr:hypothetical protein EDM56_28235 [Brevibacillus fluminis]
MDLNDLFGVYPNWPLEAYFFIRGKGMYHIKINISFILALFVNFGFSLFLLIEKEMNWLFHGLLLNFLLFLYFLSILFTLIEYIRSANKRYLYAGLLLNLIGLIMYVNYWFSL